MSKLQKGLFLIVAAIVVSFVFQNTSSVTLRFLIWKVSMSGAFFYPLLLLIGFGLGWVAFWLFTKKG